MTGVSSLLNFRVRWDLEFSCELGRILVSFINVKNLDLFTIGMRERERGIVRQYALYYVLSELVEHCCIGYLGQINHTIFFKALSETFDCENGQTVPQIFRCDGGEDCRNGADERNCEAVRFDCGNGRTIRRSYMCDGDNDCGNGADERECENSTPHTQEPTASPLRELFSDFDCGNGNKTLHLFRCDGDDDCGNGADERDCIRVSSLRNEWLGASTEPPPTRHIILRIASSPDRRTNDPGQEVSDRFDCENGKTVPMRYKCDGDNDCGNGADERDCSNDLVRFDCENGRTVLMSFKCDGDNDCGNGADERNCSNGVTSTRRSIFDLPLAPRLFERPGMMSIRRSIFDTSPAVSLFERPVFSCGGGFFECGNNRFVRRTMLCDGKDDCGNNADERNCEESTTRTSVGQEQSENHINLADSARITSPNFPIGYPNNLNLLWNVTTQPGHRIKLVFKVKELEDSTNCQADRLTLYDGQLLTSPSLGEYCRHHEGVLPDPVESSSNTMLVHFKSDYSISWMGFDLELTTVCGGALNAQTNENVLVSNPNFGDGSYGRNANCEWIIKSRTERNVELSFTTFDVGNATANTYNDIPAFEFEVNGCPDEINPDCVKYNVRQVNEATDFVEVYDGPDDSSNLIGKYSGNQIPPKITSRGEELLIRFRSGSQEGLSQGFRAVYKEV